MKRSNILLVLAAIGIIGLGFANKVKEKEALQSGNVVGPNIGNRAPEIVQKNPEGTEMKLSDYKGHVVLVDFWASWCRPCRMENPNVVNAYNKYKDAKFKDAKGLIIYNVSLDTNKDRWKKAITDDNLVWDSHVSDLKGWHSEPGSHYGVNSIPANFLLDADGIIIAKNLRGKALEDALEKLLK